MADRPDIKDHTTAVPAGIGRRFGALIYDSCLLTAILLLASVPPVMLNGGPLRDGSPHAALKNGLYFA
ncbi:MAG TPA: hypothetical protein VGL10_04285, partial [Gammaproteobacteria bacterium]